MLIADPPDFLPFEGGVPSLGDDDKGDMTGRL
jgi:hypothetical protein